MNRIQTSLTIVVGLLVALWPAASASALDLSAFQNFMQPAKTPTAKQTAKSAGEARPPARPPSVDADASFGGRSNSVITLGQKKSNARTSTQQEPFSLPAGTRYPSALTPLLTERKYPKQGSSLGGGSGGLLAPSPGVLETGKCMVAVHAVPFKLYNVNDVQIADADYFDTSVKIDFGAWEGTEVGIERTFNNQDKFDLDLPVYLNAKYQVPGNITVGTSLCTDNSGYSSAWVAAGVPVIWLGLGVNAGTNEFRFSYNAYERIRRAKFGGYNYDYSKGTGYADPVFFMVGGAVAMNPYADFVYDFNGDRFSLGMRFNYQHVAYVDAFYVADGDYERLPGPVSHRRYGNFVFGGGICF